MTPTPPPDPALGITSLLERWREGDEDAREEVVERTYRELRRIASRAMRHERHGHTLGATGLVHETYLRLTAGSPASWANRQQFYGIAGRLMRQVLIDYARTKKREKRGGDRMRITLSAAGILSDQRPPDILELDDALRELEATHPELGAVVELHCFGGLTFEEVAEALELSTSTVVRRWRRAKAWLYRLMASQGGPEP